MDEFISQYQELQSKLRSLALLYKELKNRHDPSMDIEDNIRIYKLIYSITQDTIFNKDPELQSEFRENYFEKLSEIPSNPTSELYADSLLTEFLGVSHNFHPETLRISLCDFFNSRISYTQQYIYKLLLQWAYYTEFTGFLDIAPELDCLHHDLEDCIERYQRLKNDEDYGKTVKRPVPKTVDNTNLYLHSESVQYSNISKEDIEIYLSRLIEKNSNSKKFAAFMLHLKWMNTSRRFEIWEKMVGNLVSVKHQSIARMNIVIGFDLNPVYSFLKQIDDKSPIKDYVPGMEESIEMLPTIISNIKQLQGIVEKISQEFGIKGEMELDDGHSLAYQVTHLFPELFELQKQKLEWIEYGDYESKQKALKKLNNLHFMKSHRLTSIRKSSSYSEADTPVLLSFEIISLKPQDWFDKLHKLKVQPAAWERKQRVILGRIGELDPRIVQAFNSIDVHDITVINRQLEEISSKYVSFEHNAEETVDPASVTADKKYFSILIAENIESTKTSSVKLPTQIIKALYTLLVLKNRKFKNRLIDILNVFRSVERRVALDMWDLDIRETPLQAKAADKISLKSRRDSIEEINEELYVRDSTGEFIIYDCVQDDYAKLIKTLSKIGSYYSVIYGPQLSPHFPGTDYHFMASELLELELGFQSAKQKLLEAVLYFYNNSIEKSQQQAIGQFILNLIAMKTRLDLRSHYFYESYLAHTQALNSQTAMLHAIIQTYPQGKSLIAPLFFNITDLFKAMEEILQELSLFHQIDIPKHYSFLEKSVWDSAYMTWKESLQASCTYFSDGILMDLPKFSINIIGKIQEEIKMDRRVLYPKLDKETEEIYELSLACNYATLWGMREILERNLEECMALTKIYKEQSAITGRELLTEPVDWGVKLIPEVDEGPGSQSKFNLAVFEFDKNLKAFMDFSDIECLKHLLLPWGLEEFLAVTRYQVMQKQALALAVQINQRALDPNLKILSEMFVYKKFNYIPNKYQANWKGIIEEGKDTSPDKILLEQKKIYPRLSKYFYNIQQVKANNSSNCKERLSILTSLHAKGKKDMELARLSRRIRSQIVSEYCFEVLKDIYPLSFKLQIIHVIQEYHKLMRVISPSLHKELFRPGHFYDIERSIANLETVPAISQILEFPNRPIEDLSTSSKFPGKNTMFYYNHYWNHNYEPMRLLQTLAALVQCIQIRMFLNFLSFPAIEVIDLWDRVNAGEEFWRAVPQDMASQDPQTMLEDQVSDAFSVLRVFNKNLQVVEKEDRANLIILHANYTFNVVSIALSSCYHYLNVNRKLGSAAAVYDAQCALFNLDPSEFPSQRFSVDLVGTAKNAGMLVKGCYIKDLEWTMLETTVSERNRALTINTAIQLRIENLLRHISQKTPILEVLSLIEFLKPEIKIWRLRGNFVKSKTVDFDKAMEEYKDTIEEAAEKVAMQVAKQRESVKMHTEIDLTKEYFLEKICAAAVELLESEIALLSESARVNEPYAVILPQGVSSGFLKKMNLLNGFLSVMKNRGTVVASPGGKAMVYTEKDLTALTKRFAEQVLRFKDADFKEGLGKMHIQVISLKEKMLEKEKLLLGYKKACENIEVELKNMVNAKLTQKGAQIMYELDISHRQLKEIKENTSELEIQVKERVVQEFEELLRKKTESLRELQEEFKNFQGEISDDFKQVIETSKAEGIHEIKKISNIVEKNDEGQNNEVKIIKPSTVVIMQETLRKMRVSFQWSRLREMQKFEKYISELREQLTSNQYLIDQLNESKSREALLKQELNFTQQALSASEKIVIKLQTQIREMKIQQGFLRQFKETGDKKLVTLQGEAKVYKNADFIDSTKLTAECKKQDKFMKSLKHIELSPIEQYKSFHNKYAREIENLKKSIKCEKKILDECTQQVKLAIGEADGIEYQEEDSWKKKYLELVNSQRSMIISDRSKMSIHTPEPSRNKYKIPMYPTSSTPGRSLTIIKH